MDPDLQNAISRRRFLQRNALGFGGLALGSLLQQDGYAAEVWAPPSGKPHLAPKAKSVIWLFMRGGVSHMESFDP
ncbi:MAG: twin-arginine translocation signal domain-containing protein, partial [Akkermansiaceae bacterium]